MGEPTDELTLDGLPAPPFYRLADTAGGDVFETTEVGGEPARVGALFATRGLAEEFSESATEFGMDSLSGFEPEELPGWRDIEVYAASGQDYVLVVSEAGTGLFYASDVAGRAADAAAEAAGDIPFPLYLLSDERGESPLISVEAGEEEAGGETLVAALFTSPEKARAFRDRATHLSLPDLLGNIEDRDGLRRHARIARQAGAAYAVVDPESGLTEAIPIEELAL